MLIKVQGGYADNKDMSVPESNQPQSTSEDGRNRRRFGRINAKGLRTRLGDVADLSATGMRVLCRSKPPKAGSVLQLELSHVDGAKLPIKASIAWVRRKSMFRYEAGLNFEDVNASTEAGIAAMARLALHTVSAEYHHVELPR